MPLTRLDRSSLESSAHFTVTQRSDGLFALRNEKSEALIEIVKKACKGRAQWKPRFRNWLIMEDNLESVLTALALEGSPYLNAPLAWHTRAEVAKQIMAYENISTDAEGAETLIMHTTDIVVSYVANNSIGADEVSSLIQNVHTTLASLGVLAKDEPRPEPAVSIRSSVKSDHIVCLEDGKKFKMLKRHLMTDHGMTPDEYRTRWSLPGSYPMVATDYAEKRRDLAKKIGLGRMPGQKRGRRKKASAKR